MQSDIYRAFDITEADLAMNSSGEMSPLQHTRLKTMQHTNMGLVVGVGVVTVAVIGAIFTSQPFERAIIILFPAVLLGLLMYALFARTLNTVNQDLHRRKVKAVEGVPERSMSSQGHRSQYYVLMKGRYFRVNRHQYEVFAQAVPFRLYYASRSKIVVAAERLNHHE